MSHSTASQQDAVRIQDRPVIVEAGAGTGKTWTLVERFLHLLETNPAWPLESIAAVTFTEKAAREMRTRLRAAIVEKAEAAGPESPWPVHRRGLERLQVGTIHGLCARILRENAIAAGIDPLFSVLDERQAEVLQEEAVRRCFIELVEADDPALELLSALRVRDLGEQILVLLSQRGSVERLFAELPAPAALVDRWWASLPPRRLDD